MGSRTITEWATAHLVQRLDGLEIAEGVRTVFNPDGVVRGEVSLAERKGKWYTVYNLEVELPFEGTSEGVSVSGIIHLPDISLEMLDDLEVIIQPQSDLLPAELDGLLASDGVATMQGVVREWAATVRKAVAESASDIPLDPPTQTQQPRAAALISEEEAMSAAGAAALDDAQDEEEEQTEEVPHVEERPDGQPEEEPFTAEEVEQMLQEVRRAIEDSFPEEAGNQQLQELESELEGKDLQQQGRILVDVLEFLNNPEAEGEGADEREDGNGVDGAEHPPYEGEEALMELWKDVVEMCNEADVPNLEDELKGRPPEEQWRMLLDVRDYLLNGDEEEREAFARWRPTVKELEREWQQLLQHVPDEELEDLQADWNTAGAEEKKRLVWDVRKFLEQQDDDEEGGGPDQRDGQRARLDDGVGKNEVRRRGSRRGAEYEYNYEYDFDQQPYDKDFNYGYDSKGKRARRNRQRSLVLFSAAVCLSLTVALLFAATAMAAEDESVVSAALRLLRVS